MKINLTILIASLILLAILALAYLFSNKEISLRNSDKNVIVKKTPVGAIPQDKFAKKHIFPYAVPEARKNKILAGLKSVKTCLTKNEIKSLLGEPDYGDQNFGSKTTGITAWQGSKWYYIFKADNIVGKSTDPIVIVYFDTQDRVIKVFTRAIDSTKFPSIDKCNNNS